MKNQPVNEAAEFLLTHAFDAPKDAVFNAFADAEALGEWWGPVECNNSVLSLDFRTGGMFHYQMDYQGRISYGRFIFGLIQPYDLLEFTTSFADKQGNMVPAPFEIQIPKEIFYRLRFTEENGRTTITLTGRPVGATDEESSTFTSINADMQRGFGATFNKLVEYLRQQGF